MGENVYDHTNTHELSYGHKNYKPGDDPSYHSDGADGASADVKSFLETYSWAGWDKDRRPDVENSRIKPGGVQVYDGIYEGIENDLTFLEIYNPSWDYYYDLSNPWSKTTLPIIMLDKVSDNMIDFFFYCTIDKPPSSSFDVECTLKNREGDRLSHKARVFVGDKSSPIVPDPPGAWIEFTATSKNNHLYTHEVKSGDVTLIENLIKVDISIKGPATAGESGIIQKLIPIVKSLPDSLFRYVTIGLTDATPLLKDRKYTSKYGTEIVNKAKVAAHIECAEQKIKAIEAHNIKMRKLTNINKEIWRTKNNEKTYLWARQKIWRGLSATNDELKEKLQLMKTRNNDLIKDLETVIKKNTVDQEYINNYEKELKNVNLDKLTILDEAYSMTFDADGYIIRDGKKTIPTTIEKDDLNELLKKKKYRRAYFQNQDNEALDKDIFWIKYWICHIG